MDNNFNNIYDENNVNNTVTTPPKKKFKGSRVLIVLAIIIGIIGVFALGMLAGHFTTSQIAKENPMMDEVYSLAKKYYIDDVTKDQFDLIFSVGMLTGLDRYTGIILASSDTSEYGITLSSDKYNIIKVTDIKDGSPMYGKIMRGDEIIGMKTKDTDEWITTRHLDYNVFQNYVKASTTLYLKVQRGDEVVEYGPFIKLREVKDREAEYRETGVNGIGYIKLDSFTNDASADFMAALEQFLNSANNNNIMLLDLRNNPGGSTIELARILNNFIPNKGKNEVLNIKDRNGKSSKTYAEEVEFTVRNSAGSYKVKNTYVGDKVKSKTGKDFKLVILANGDSASAAEAFIGNILHYMDTKDYMLLGEDNMTFGKGIAQGNFPLKTNSNYILHMTIGYYYVHGPKNTSDENEYINIHNTGYHLDVDGITYERKPNILDESAVRVGISKAQAKWQSKSDIVA